MDTRVLLANANKRYEAIFEGLGILNQQIVQLAQGTDAGLNVVYEKLIEVDNKIDLVLAHLGIEVPAIQETEPASNDTSEVTSPATESESDSSLLVQ